MSVVGVTLLAQVHRLLQCLTRLVCFFAHVNHSSADVPVSEQGSGLSGFSVSGRALSGYRGATASHARGIAAASGLTTGTRRGG